MSFIVKLRAGDGSWLYNRATTGPVATTTSAAEPTEWIVATARHRLSSGDRVNLATVRWDVWPRDHLRMTGFDLADRPGDTLWTKPGGTLGVADGNIEIRRLDHDGTELRHGDRIALLCRDARQPGWLEANSGIVHAVPGSAPGDRAVFTVETRSPLRLHFSDARLDHFTAVSSAAEKDAVTAGYRFLRTQGRIELNDGEGRRALFLFWHAGNGDNVLGVAGESERELLAAGYTKVRLEGYVLDKALPGMIPLRTYWRGAERRDFFTATTRDEERSAAAVNYQFIRDEGYVYPPTAQDLAPPPAPGTIPVATAANPAVIAAATGHLGVGLVGHIAGGLIQIPTRRRRRDSNKRALVLSGGGAKGCFEVGAVKRLWEQGYRPDIVCGVSVGALNAAKLAEGTPSAASELETAWRRLRPTSLGGLGGAAVYRKDYFVDLVLSWLGNMLVDGLDDIAGGNLAGVIDWIKYAAAHLHAVHFMKPLREMIRANLDFGALRRSGIQLRVGVTDVKSGQYFSVTEPFAATNDGLDQCGRIEPEPDHRMGDTWLSRPIYGADGYAISIEDAIYASCTLPVFMDPAILNLRNARVVPFGAERLALLRIPMATVAAPGGPAPTAPPPVKSLYTEPMLAELLRATNDGAHPFDGTVADQLKNHILPPYSLDRLLRVGYDADWGDANMAHRQLFDGGLRDTMAIRTAIRLGAREIIVITGDRLQTATWSLANPGTMKTDMMALPFAQYLFGLLGIWFNEAARTDMLLAVAQNEFLGWLYRCFSLLDQAKRTQLLGEFNAYWRTHGERMREVLGGTTWIGGDTAQTYGTPFVDEGCSIRYIAPDRELVGALDFDNWPAIEAGLEHGYEAAASPVELSFPVPDALANMP